MNDKLFKIYKYAVENNPFYRELYAETGCNFYNEVIFNANRDKLPIVKKSMLRDNVESILSSPYKQFPKYEDLSIIRSSGSTGEYLKIYWDKKDTVRSMLPSWIWRKKYYQITPLDKYISFHTVKHIGNKFIEDIVAIDEVNERHTSFSKINLDENRITSFFEYVNKYNPVWMHLQPSILTLLYQQIDDKNKTLPNSIMLIETTGEYFSKEIKNEMSKKLGIRIVDNYGCTETNYIACECPCGKMHILSDNVFVEIVDENSGVVKKNDYGNILVTSLHNHAMPLIRYDTGDIGRIEYGYRCNCGNMSPVLELKGVRNSHVIKCCNKNISSYVVLYAIEKINEQFNNAILQYKVTQKSMVELMLELVIDKKFLGWEDTISKSFIDYIPDSNLKNIKWNITYKDHIYPDSQTGKLQFFKSNI